VEIGDGFSLVEKKGSESNDEMDENGFKSNHHGGVLGGLSSGEEIVVRLAIKPTSSLPKEQDSVDLNGVPVKVVTKGRHDPCVAIRAVPIAEAMLALVLVNLLMEQESRVAF
jgi:chorismate synthase